MRMAFLTLFLCTGVTAICQSAATKTETPVTSFENALKKSAWSASKELSLESSIPSLAPLTEKHRFNPPTTWCLDNAQSDPKKIPPALLFNSGVVAFHMDGAQWPNLKRGPIPTQWSNLTVQQLPTDWPNLKVVLIASQLNPPTTLPAPLNLIK